MGKLTQEDMDYILYLYKNRNRKVKEIAEATGFSITTVKNVAYGMRDKQNQKAKERYHAKKKAQQAETQEQDAPMQADIEPKASGEMQIHMDYALLTQAIYDALERFFSTHAIAGG